MLISKIIHCSKWLKYYLLCTVFSKKITNLASNIIFGKYEAVIFSCYNMQDKNDGTCNMLSKKRLKCSWITHKKCQNNHTFFGHFTKYLSIL